MELLDVTQVAEALLTLLIAVCGVVYTYLRNKSSNADQLDRWVQIAVSAAEQAYKTYATDDRKQYALDILQKQGLKVDWNKVDDMIEAAKQVSEQYHCAVLCKGGHKLNDANDLLYEDGTYQWFEGKRIDNPNTHGTGCTLSSAIASNLAKGFSMVESVNRAKDYISGALAAMLDLGKGSGPMDHGFAIKNSYTEEA